MCGSFKGKRIVIYEEPQKRIEKELELTKLEFSDVVSCKRNRLKSNLFTLIEVKRIDSTLVNSEPTRATSF